MMIFSASLGLTPPHCVLLQVELPDLDRGSDASKGSRLRRSVHRRVQVVLPAQGARRKGPDDPAPDLHPIEGRDGVEDAPRLLRTVSNDVEVEERPHLARQSVHVNVADLRVPSARLEHAGCDPHRAETVLCRVFGPLQENVQFPAAPDEVVPDHFHPDLRPRIRVLVLGRHGHLVVEKRPRVAGARLHRASAR